MFRIFDGRYKCLRCNLDLGSPDLFRLHTEANNCDPAPIIIEIDDTIPQHELDRMNDLCQRIRPHLDYHNRDIILKPTPQPETPVSIHIPPLNCAWCCKTFVNKRNLRLHSCKLKNDYIRNMELQLGLYKVLPVNKCRFCNTNIVHTKNMSQHYKTCPNISTYTNQLEEKLKTLQAKV